MMQFLVKCLAYLAIITPSMLFIFVFYYVYQIYKYLWITNCTKKKTVKLLRWQEDEFSSRFETVK